MAEKETSNANGNIITSEYKTPAAKSNRMDWGPKDFAASELLGVEVRMTSKESKKGERPYLVLTPKEQPTIAAMVEQVLADQAKGSTKLITSKEGQPITINADVQVGVRNGEFFFL